MNCELSVLNYPNLFKLKLRTVFIFLTEVHEFVVLGQAARKKSKEVKYSCWVAVLEIKHPPFVRTNTATTTIVCSCRHALHTNLLLLLKIKINNKPKRKKQTELEKRREESLFGCQGKHLRETNRMMID